MSLTELLLLFIAIEGAILIVFMLITATAIRFIGGRLLGEIETLKKRFGGDRRQGGSGGMGGFGDIIGMLGPLLGGG